MRSSFRALLKTIALVAVAAGGAGIALGLNAAFDDGSVETVREVTTIVERQPAPTSATAEFAAGPANDESDETATQEPDSARAASEASPREATSASEPGEVLSAREIYEAASSGVVQITAVSPVGPGRADPYFDPFSPEQQQRSLGSGFVIDDDGHIVTNFHVVQGADEVEVNFSGEDRMRAVVVGVDPSTDLAVIKIMTDENALNPLAFGDSDLVAVGDPVVAIGNPFGLERTLTAGVVSALQRNMQAPNGFRIENVIQTDAPINSGNSGGPLLNERGEVIGVNTQIVTGGLATGNVGIGFAVPANTVRDVAEALIDSGIVERPWLGITMHGVSEELAETVRVPTEEGAIVAAVAPDSPAEEAGLRGGDRLIVIDGTSYQLGGDIITAADGAPVESPDDLQRVLRDREPGDTLKLGVIRGDEQLEISVELGRRPGDG